MLLIAHPLLLVQVTSERFLPTWVAFKVGLASESHWLQPVLVFTVHWWLALVSVGGLYAVSSSLSLTCGTKQSRVCKLS